VARCTPSASPVPGPSPGRAGIQRREADSDHAASECALRLAFVLVKTADAARGTVMVRIGAPTPVRTAQPKRPLSLR